MGKPVYFDTTFLEHAKDLRGIPQVILQVVRLFLAEDRFAGVRFIATRSAYARFLAPLGLPESRVRWMGCLPGPLGAERFHGLFSTWRYRSIAREAALIIHPELRTVLRSAVPQMVFYYDFIIFEGASVGGKRKWTRYLWYYLANRLAARVRFKAAISGHTRKRAFDLFPRSQEGEGIEVLHLGARSAVRGGGEPKSLGAGRIQCLYVGSFEARKNIDALLRRLPEVLGDLPADLHLVGHLAPERRAELQALVDSSGQSGRVRLHGLVDDAALEARYREAHFLLFPTLFEGFGLPMVEAMGYGAVVCAFDNSCIAEVGGGALVLRPDNDFAGWGREIRALAADPAAYAARSRQSLERAAHFSEAGMMERYGAYMAKAMASLEAR